MEIKGPFSYSGNKYKIYKAHLKPIFDEFDQVIEPFAGSAPILYNAKGGGIGSDTNKAVVFMHNSLKIDEIDKKMEEIYHFYFKNGLNKDSYMELRSFFNEKWKLFGFFDEIAPHFLLLCQLSFNSLVRFSKNGYNVPFGMKKPDFNRVLIHSNISKSRNITIFELEYDKLDISLCKNAIIYLDPPYIASKYQYNGWNVEDDVKLLEYIDNLNKIGRKFVLSNTLYHRGVKNEHLNDWISKYNVKYIDKNYNSWSAAVKSVKNYYKTCEIIVDNL